MVWIGNDGEPRSAGRASKTVVLHRQIYAADPLAHCVIHTHSTHLVALSLMSAASTGDDLLPALTPYFVMKVGHVPRIAYHRPGDPAVAPLVVQQIQEASSKNQRLNAVMCDRLGPVVWQSSAAGAMAVLEELEETARLCVLTQRHGPEPLTSTQIDELRKHFGASW